MLAIEMGAHKYCFGACPSFVLTPFFALRRQGTLISGIMGSWLIDAGKHIKKLMRHMRWGLFWKQYAARLWL